MVICVKSLGNKWCEAYVVDCNGVCLARLIAGLPKDSNGPLNVKLMWQQSLDFSESFYDVNDLTQITII